MPSTLSPQLSTSATPSGSFGRRLLPFVLFSVLWLDLIRLLSTQWETREQYAYGWFIPFFAAALFWRRWLDRPSRAYPSTLPKSRGLVVRSLVVLSLAVLLPLRVIYEINTDWPFISWLYTLIVVAATLYAVFLAGGWREVRHFAFPICFILVAVVWPSRLEKGLIQDLMRVVATITVEILCWLDIPAFQRGNLIDLSTGTVGIEEACSGIRSLQSSLMAGLVMGELYRMRLGWRMVLVGSGLLLGFCFNIVRTLLLSWQAGQNGVDALEKWHDPAGWSITVACFFCLWAMASLLRKWTATPEPRAPQSASESPVVPWSCSPLVRQYLLAVGCWSLCLVLVTEAWYRSHEIKAPGRFHWSVNFPVHQSAYKEIPLAERTRTILGHDEGGCGSWTDEKGVNWSLYFFRWKPTSIEAVLRARIHRPERCLPAAGLEQVADGGPANFEAAGFRLPFRQYTYRSEGKTVHVFFCQWEDGSDKQVGMWGSKLGDRLRSVLVGRRKLGQQTLEIILAGPESLSQAANLVRTELPQLIRPESPALSRAN